MIRSELQRLLIQEISNFNRKLRAQFDASVRRQGLTLSRVRVLQAVSGNEGLAQNELAAHLEIETPTLVRLLDSMEQQDMIVRRSCDSDRRVKRITLTANGEKVSAEVSAYADEFRAELMQDLDDEALASALGVTQQLIARLGLMGQEAGADVE